MKIRVIALILVLALLPAFVASAETKTVRIGISRQSSPYNVRSKPGGATVGRVEPGDTVLVIGEKDEWYAIWYGGKKAYVAKEAITILREDVALDTDAAFTVIQGGAAFSTVIASGSPITGIGFFITNAAVTAYTVTLSDGAGNVVKTVSREGGKSLYYIEANALMEGFVAAGDAGSTMHLSVTFTGKGETKTVYDRAIYVAKDPYWEPRNITGSCRYTATGDGNAAYLTDNQYMNAWESDGAGDVEIGFPDGVQGGAVLLTWAQPSPDFRVSCLDEGGNEIASQTRCETQNLYRQLIACPDGTRTVRIHMEKCGITELDVYDQEEALQAQSWEVLPEKVDFMVFSAHLDDELLWFGGAIPYYVAQGKTVGVVYMTRSGPVRKNESLNAMWDCGVRYHPVYLDMADGIMDSYEEAVELWGYDIAMERVVEQIRRYKPEVILTHDFEGEYGHNQHKLTSALLSEAVTRAADPAQFPASAEKYGAWQVKKLYIHRYAKSDIVMDWDQPLEYFDGKSSLDVTKAAYLDYVTQQERYSMAKGRRFDYNWFGLYYSAVGADVAKNDMFENVTDSAPAASADAA